MSVLAYFPPDPAYRRLAAWPIGAHRIGAYLWGMTTYTTPHFATGNSDLRSEPPLTRTRPASAAPYRTAGVSNEAAVMADGPTPDWQPAAAKGGVPKAAIGALGAALVGGAALAIVLLAPSNKVTKQVQPDPIAQASAQKTVDPADAAVTELDKNAPAAGTTADSQAAAAAQQASAAAVPAPVQNVIPDAPPVVNAPVARLPRHVTPTPRPAAERTAPAPTPDVPAQSVTPPADVQPPAMQQTPDTTTVTPSVPATPPAPTPDTGTAPTPAPAQ